MSGSVYQVARKELNAFFSSPVGFLFVGAFLAITLFIFFWVETFFARNIADVRPLFEWMPILLIFLVASLTMRMWSEERRLGTLELLLTLPVSTLQLVLGKFIACLLLVGIALLLTLPLPFTVELLGSPDWGPIIGAYIASLFLAAVYVAVGLFVSANCENQIVSLIVTVLLCLVFYLAGTPIFGGDSNELLRMIGTGTRFESITRGVIDLRDIYYYLSLVGVFVALNVLSIEKLRWASTPKRSHTIWRGITALLALNFLVANLWLNKLPFFRADLTKGNLYSISDSTRQYLTRLQEPLLIRAYISTKTHPLLAPLVPQLRDLIREFEVAGNGKVQAEFIDPIENPELEEQANSEFGIKPVPFTVESKYEQSLVSSYFNIVVKYGDKFEVLSFQDLIDIKAPVTENDDIEVRLRNPEYDITRSIKKVLYGFQGVDHLFSGLSSPIKFTGYVSDSSVLPETLHGFRNDLQGLLSDLKSEANGKFEFAFMDPGSADSEVATQLNEEFGFRPMATLFDPQPFFFYMTLAHGEQVVQLPLPKEFTKERARETLEAGLKRFSSGFLKTVGLVTPAAAAPNPFMPQQQGGKQFRLMQEKLQENFQIKKVDLKAGSVPEDVDLLLVISPEKLDMKEVFAIDQFLMKGGNIVLSASPYSISSSRSALTAKKTTLGLEDWLTHHGISFDNGMVLDTQNESFPVPVQRQVGAIQVEQIAMVPYPFNVDIRGDALNQENGITAGIPQVTLNWPSPIRVESPDGTNRTVTTLLKSSPEAWLSESTNISPDFERYPRLGFAPTGSGEQFPLAVIVEGEFKSFFADKKSPLLEETPKEEPENPEGAEAKEEKPPVISGVISHSPESSRIIVFASNEFLTDQALGISMSMGGGRYMNSLQITENALDWALEDRTLLAIRSRGHYARTLVPLTKMQKVFWEYLNIGLAFFGLLLVFLAFRAGRGRSIERYNQLLQTQGV